MIKPVYTEEMQQVLKAPPGVANCGTLPIVKSEVGMHSCWEMTQDDWLDIRNNGFKIYLTVMGTAHPAVLISVDKPYIVNQGK